MGNYFATPDQSRGGDQHAPPSQPESFTCEICIEPTQSVAQTFRPKNANCAAHSFCNNCMVKYIEAKLDDDIPEIPCPALACPEFLDPNEYRVLVGSRLFVRWCDALCRLALVETDQFYCPNPKCSELVVNECGGAAAVKKVACPSCKTKFCFQCKLTWHAGFQCEELRDQNDRAFWVLADQSKWMRCPKCHHFVERVLGCRRIKCRCLAMFCYSCGAQDPAGCACNRLVESYTRSAWFWILGLVFIFSIIELPIFLKYCTGENC